MVPICLIENHPHEHVIFATTFSVDINKLPVNFQMECIELQSNYQIKEKFYVSFIRPL